jgi:hypothetical protein
MDLGQALYQMMVGGASGEPATFGDSVRYLAQDYSSVSAMARDLSVPRSTLRGWLGGRTPRGGGPSGIVDQARYQWRSEALSGREQSMRRDWSTDSLTVKGTYTYAGKSGPAPPTRTGRSASGST